MPEISLIAAIDNNNAIGKNGDMLCHLPNDLKHFRTVTEGHTVIMGRKTYESLPNGALPNRRNIVISRNKNLHYDNTEIYTSLEEAMSFIQNKDEVFIIGGGELYKQSITRANKLYITHIHYSFQDTDTYFPSIDNKLWKRVSDEKHSADKENEVDYTFSIYVRIS